LIDDPGSYAIGDFIPFTAEVYLRLFERQNEALWPAHLLAMPMGVAALALAWRGWGRGLALVLAIVWAWVAVMFHLRLYTELTWAAQYFGGAFLVQAVLLFGCGVFGSQNLNREARDQRRGGPVVTGLALAVIGLAMFPLLAPVTGRNWSGAEWFAIAPDPTVLATLGLLLVAARPVWLLVLLPVPLLWCALSGAVLWELEQPLAWVMPAAAGVAVAGAVWKGVTAGRGEVPSEPDLGSS
jgi:xanthine/uracil permease